MILILGAMIVPTAAAHGSTNYWGSTGTSNSLYSTYDSGGSNWWDCWSNNWSNNDCDNNWDDNDWDNNCGSTSSSDIWKEFYCY